MFSKALFKQSCKANGTMWVIITFAVCFMLACVMLISGSDSIGSTITAVEDTIIDREITAAMDVRAINYYENETDGLKKFDELFIGNMAAGSGEKPRLAADRVRCGVHKLMRANPRIRLRQGSYDKPRIHERKLRGAGNARFGYVCDKPNGTFDEFYTEHGEAGARKSCAAARRALPFGRCCELHKQSRTLGIHSEQKRILLCGVSCGKHHETGKRR